MIFQKELALVTPSPFRPYGMMNGIMESASLDRCRLVPSAFRYLMTPPGPTFFGEGCADSIDELTLLGQRAYIRSRFFEESSRIPSPQVWDSASLEECDTRIVLMGARPYSSRSGLEAANVVLTVLSLGLIPAYSDSPEYRLDFSQSQALAARGKAEIVVVHGERSIVSVLFVPLLGSLNQAHSIAEQAEQQHRMGDALLKELERRL